MHVNIAACMQASMCFGSLNPCLNANVAACMHAWMSILQFVFMLECLRGSLYVNFAACMHD